MAKPQPTTVTVAVTDDGRFLLAALLSKEQLQALVELVEPNARSWRGQYQSMAKAIVDAATQSMTGPTASP